MRIGNARLTGLAFVAAGLATAIAVRAKRLQRAYTFRGKSIVVTGGSRGLGLVLARQLAAEGARITLIARDENELRRAADDIRDRHPSADVLIVRADVGQREDVESAISQTTGHRGTIDVLINNAGWTISARFDCHRLVCRSDTSCPVSPTHDPASRWIADQAFSQFAGILDGGVACGVSNTHQTCSAVDILPMVVASGAMAFSS